MHSRFLLKSAPLLLAGSLVFFGASTAHAQGFTFTAPTTTVFTVHPGDDVNFSGSFHNGTFVDFMNVIINLGPAPGSYPGKFTFTSPFSVGDMAFGQTLKFTGVLHISKTATFSTQAFYLDASGFQDDSGTGDPQPADLTSDNFTVKLVPNAPAVPEASTTVSLGLLLGGLALLGIRARKRGTAGV